MAGFRDACVRGRYALLADRVQCVTYGDVDDIIRDGIDGLSDNSPAQAVPVVVLE